MGLAALWELCQVWENNPVNVIMFISSGSALERGLMQTEDVEPVVGREGLMKGALHYCKSLKFMVIQYFWSMKYIVLSFSGYTRHEVLRELEENDELNVSNLYQTQYTSVPVNEIALTRSYNFNVTNVAECGLTI